MHAPTQIPPELNVGADAGNYSFTSNTTTTADITPLAVTVGVSAEDKVYDGTASAVITALGSSGILAGDTVDFSGNPGVFSDKNVATGKTVTVEGITASGADAGNYSFNTVATTTADITPLAVTVGISAEDKVYDGTTAATTVLGSTGILAGDTVDFSGNPGVFGDKNVAAGKTVTVDGIAASGADAGNYSFNTVATTTADITPLAVTVGISAGDKVYDGTASAVITALGSGGILAGDTVDFSGDPGAFGDKNAATGKTVTVEGITASGADAGNYSFNTVATTTADITPLAVTVGISAGDKVYDGTTAAVITALGSGGILAGDTVDFSGNPGVFSDKNVATGKTVTVEGIAASGADAGNYSFNTVATTTADITPLAITVGVSAEDKVYDGTTAATTVLGSTGILAGDTVNFSGDPGAFSDKNAATGKTVTVDGIAASGADAGNYTLNTVATTTADITPLAITVEATGSNKVYDGTSLAGVSLSSTGVLAGDTVSFSDGSASYSDKNVAAGKTITVTGITATGADAGNYSFNATASTSGDITPLAITGTIVADGKVYDGGIGAVTHGTLTGVLVGDDVSFGTHGLFGDKNVASGKTVTVAGSLGGADAGNYSFTSNTTTTADITPLAVTVGVSAEDKVYDGTTAATTVLGSTGILAGDAVDFSGNPGVFGDKNVAAGKTVTVDGIAASGADAGNYIFNTVATTTADITPLAVTVGISAEDKVYDGTASAVITALGSGGILAGDTVDFSGDPGAFSDKNAATGKTVTVEGITASGADAGNYSFNTVATTTADITPLAVIVGAHAGDKVYDGTTAADAIVGSSGVLGGDTVDFTAGSAAFGDKNAGNGKTVTVEGITASGADAGNYTFNTVATTTADITPLAITGTILAGDKVYDGTTSASVSGSLSGVLAGDQVGLASSGGFRDKNAGTGRTVDVSGSLTGADAGNYVLAANATTTADITPVVLNLTGTRVYDGTVGAAASLFGNDGVLAGVNGETLTLGGSGVLGDKNVGTRKGFAEDGLAGYTLTGNDGASAGNYTLAGGTDWVTITPATLTVTGAVAHDRAYDGTRDAAITGATLAGLFGNDEVVLGNAGAGLFDTRNAGVGKAVATAMTIAGGDAGNYVLVQPAGLVADVTPRSITVVATGTDKLFDGKTDDQVTLGSDGVLPGDQVGFTSTGAHFADPAVGNGKTVTVTGIALTGADAANYAVEPTTTTTANITGGRPASFGVAEGLLAQLQYPVGPSPLDTPYGVAEDDTVGVFTGNQKKQRRPLEHNRKRGDFTSGLSLEVVDGGVRMPSRLLP